MANASPVWTDFTTVIASQVLARNAVVSGTIDLSTKYGAYFFVRVGRTGTTGLTDGVALRVNRTISGNTIAHPGAHFGALGQSTAANSTTVNADTAAGQKTINVASTTGFAAEDFVVIGAGTARQEWARVARVTDATHLLLDRNLTNAHTAVQADPVLNKADVYPPIFAPGGCVYEVILDYGNDTTGESVQVEVLAQTYNSDVIQ